MAQRILSNNQINVLGLWQELVERLRKLERLGGLKRVGGQFVSDTCIAVTIPDPDIREVKKRYTIGLNPLRCILYVQWEEDGILQPRTYRPTRRLLNHAIVEVEEAIDWQQQRIEEDDPMCPCGCRSSQHYLGDGHCETEGCGCPQFGEPVENWETHTITSVGDGPGGFYIVE